MLRLNMILTVAFFALGAANVIPTIKEPCTIIKQGKICGEILQSRQGRKFAAFKGIPYAKPPVGDLRFKDPEVAGNWQDTFHATKDAPSCVQKNYLLADPFVEGQEDCLYLNIYTPLNLSGNETSKGNYPVMFYIHGGGFFSGSGNSSLHGPEYLMDENIVLVTINYRLGIFGFLSTSDDAAPGNWGLKDMVLALKWVQDNIKYFWGLENSVTIFGQSAGSASTHYLMLSSLAKGLFHRAIMQSGSALNLFATPINSIDVAKFQATFVNCPTETSTVDLVNCLRKVDAETLVESGDNFKVWSVDPLNVFLPSVEKQSENNSKPFLTDYPLNLINKGQIHKVPLMIGVMENEGIIRAAPISSQCKLRNDLNSRWDELGPQLFAVAQSVSQNLTLAPSLWKNFTNFYMKGKNCINYKDPQSIQNFINMYSDRGFIYGVYQSAVKHANLGQSPIYFYKFNYAGRDSWSTVFEGNSNTAVNFEFNKSHCDDLNYLFRITDFFPDPFPNGSLDLEMSKQIVHMWANFAKNGYPTAIWETIQPNNFRYLEIKGPKDMQMKTDFLTERMNFWRSQQIEENK